MDSVLDSLQLKYTHKLIEYGVGSSLTVLQGQGLSVLSSREYERGDDWRNIDRKSTAKSGTLHTKQKQHESHLNLHIYLKPTRSHSVLTLYQEVLFVFAFLAVHGGDFWKVTIIDEKDGQQTAWTQSISSLSHVFERFEKTSHPPLREMIMYILGLGSIDLGKSQSALGGEHLGSSEISCFLSDGFEDQSIAEYAKIKNNTVYRVDILTIFEDATSYCVTLNGSSGITCYSKDELKEQIHKEILNRKNFIHSLGGVYISVQPGDNIVDLLYNEFILLHS